MIKNIVFDLGNVLIKGHSFESLAEIIKDEDDIKYIKEFFSENWNDVDKGQLTIEDMLINSKMPTCIKEKYADYILNYFKYRPLNNDLFDLISKLKANDYKIYILSDNSEEAGYYWLSQPEFDSIDGYVISATYGYLKQEGKLFEIFFNKYDLKPNECFFVDDSPEKTNVGKSYGMKVHVFDYENNGIEKLMEDMNQIGILL